jgi:hypothetical protein
MAATRFELFLALAVSAALLAACGGGGKTARPIVIPTVAPGAYETPCQTLCTLAPGEKICTATHAEFCLERCRAATQNLPTACADCLIAQGTPIAGYTNGGSYCDVGGPADVTACEAECDDGGSAPPAPELDTQCQLACGFYVQEPQPLACSAAGSADCLTACRAAIAANGRICAQCLIAQTMPSRVCINDECDCSPSFSSDALFGCANLCDAVPPGA